MSLEENKAFITRMTDEFWNTGNMAVVGEFFADNYVQHGPTGTMDMEQFKQTAAAYFAGFPDLHITTDHLIAEGDKVVKRWTARFTHAGEYMGIPPTGNKMLVEGIEIFRIANGKIVEVWAEMDVMGMLRQLGVIPPAEPSEG
jgi:steroid delta-isomerase-like uncharacterized protein